MVGKQLIENVIKQIGTKVKTDYVHKEAGKGLSTEDYTSAEKTKLSNIEANAEVNIIEDVKVNGTSIQVSNKSVDIPVPTKVSDIANDSGFIDKDVNDLTNYNLSTQTGSQIQLAIDTDYKMTAILKDKNGNTIYTSNVIDLPLETMVVDATYDNTTKEVVLTLQNGNTTRFSVADLVNGLVSTTQLNTILANYYTQTEIDTMLADYVKKTDYATSNEAGVVKVNGPLTGTEVGSTGYLKASEATYADYLKKIGNFMIGKTTLENVIKGKQLINQTKLDESQATQNEEIARLRSDIDGIGLVGTAEGTSIDLTDSVRARFSHRNSDGLVIEGNSTQETTKGYNLLKYDKGTTTINGVTFRKNKDASITMTGTPTSYTRFNLSNDFIHLPAGEYTLVEKHDINPTGDTHLDLYDDTDTARKVFYITEGAGQWRVSKLTLQTDSNIIGSLYTNSQSSVDGVTIQIMLLAGTYTSSTTPDFERYTNRSQSEPKLRTAYI